MGRISKYTKEQKLQAVFHYKNGTRKIIDICKELDLHPSGKAVYHWIAQYEKDGETAFDPKVKNMKYDKGLKEAAIKEYLDGKGSYKEVANKYNISSPSVLENWINKQRGIRIHKNLKAIDMLRQENRKLKQELKTKERKYNVLKKLENIKQESDRKGSCSYKYLVIKDLHETENYSINWMCQELAVTRTAYYKWLMKFKG